MMGKHKYAIAALFKKLVVGNPVGSLGNYLEIIGHDEFFHIYVHCLEGKSDDHPKIHQAIPTWLGSNHVQLVVYGIVLATGLLSIC